jgi:hypothetical protein
MVDVSIDQGGCFETSRPTTHAEPVYAVDGIIHYCVANIPGAVPRTSTYALNHATLPFVKELAGRGFLEALKANADLRNGLNICSGAVTCRAVAQALGYARCDDVGQCSQEAALEQQELQRIVGNWRDERNGAAYAPHEANVARAPGLMTSRNLSVRTTPAKADSSAASGSMMSSSETTPTTAPSPLVTPSRLTPEVRMVSMASYTLAVFGTMTRARVMNSPMVASPGRTSCAIARTTKSLSVMTPRTLPSSGASAVTSSAPMCLSLISAAARNKVHDAGALMMLRE